MNPKYERAANRLRELIEEGGKVAALERQSEYGMRYIQDKVQLHSWLVKVENIVRSVFGAGGPHLKHVAAVIEKNPEHSYEVNQLVGILSGALNDLEGGFLIGQEHLIAGDIFDSVLEQARYLAKNDFNTAVQERREPGHRARLTH